MNVWMKVLVTHFSGLDDVYVRVLNNETKQNLEKVKNALSYVNPTTVCRGLTIAAPVIAKVNDTYIRCNVYARPSGPKDPVKVLDVDVGCVLDVDQKSLYTVPEELLAIGPTVYRVGVAPERALSKETLAEDMKSLVHKEVNMKILHWDVVPEVIFDVPFLNTQVTKDQFRDTIIWETLKRAAVPQEPSYQTFFPMPKVELPPPLTLTKDCRVMSYNMDNGNIFVTTPQLKRDLPPYDIKQLSLASPKIGQPYVGVKGNQLYRVIMRSLGLAGFNTICVDSGMNHLFRELFVLPLKLAEIPPQCFVCTLDKLCAPNQLTYLSIMKKIDIIITSNDIIPKIRAYINGFTEEYLPAESPDSTDEEEEFEPEILEDDDDDDNINLDDLNVSSDGSEGEFDDLDCEMVANVYQEITAICQKPSQDEKMVVAESLEEKVKTMTITEPIPEWPPGIQKVTDAVCTNVNDFKRVVIIEGAGYDDLLKMEKVFSSMYSNQLIKVEEASVICEKMYIADVEGIVQRVIFMNLCNTRKGFFVERYDRGGTFLFVRAMYEVPEEFRAIPKFAREVTVCERQLKRVKNFHEFKTLLLTTKELCFFTIKDDKVSPPEVFFLVRDELLDIFEVYRIYEDSQIKVEE